MGVFGAYAVCQNCDQHRALVIINSLQAPVKKNDSRVKCVSVMIQTKSLFVVSVVTGYVLFFNRYQIKLTFTNIKPSIPISSFKQTQTKSLKWKNTNLNNLKRLNQLKKNESKAKWFCLQEMRHKAVDVCVAVFDSVSEPRQQPNSGTRSEPTNGLGELGDSQRLYQIKFLIQSITLLSLIYCKYLKVLPK